MLEENFSHYKTFADEIISKAYPGIYNKGKGWWGDKRIPNYGILRNAIVAAIENLKKETTV